jgi:cytochrome P450
MLDFLSEDMRRNPFPIYDVLRPQQVFQPPGSDVWMVLEYEAVKHTLQDHETFSSAAAGAGSQPAQWLIFSDPPRHTKLRGLVMRAFTGRMVSNLEPRIRELSRGLLDDKIARGEMDLAVDFSIPLPMMVIAQMLGAPSTDWPRFKHWTDVMLDLSQTVAGGEQAQRAEEAFGVIDAEMNAYLSSLLEQRRARPEDDLLTKLLDAEVDGERLDQGELLGFFQILLLAGSETTTNLINNAILCFLEHPRELARLRASPELLPSTIEEVLRYRSPVQATFRVTKRAAELPGGVIPAGSLVLPLIGSANRDPGHFFEPNRFDIARDPNPHIAFGHGAHFCLGAALSRLEAKVAIGDLVNRLAGFELAGSEPWEPRKAFHVHGPARLPIRFEPGARVGGGRRSAAR